jgi:hypothetical protein
MTCDLTACGVVHWSVFDILNLWRGHPVVLHNYVVTKSNTALYCK